MKRVIGDYQRGDSCLKDINDISESDADQSAYERWFREAYTESARQNLDRAIADSPDKTFAEFLQEDV